MLCRCHQQDTQSELESTADDRRTIAFAAGSCTPFQQQRVFPGVLGLTDQTLCMHSASETAVGQALRPVTYTFSPGATSRTVVHTAFHTPTPTPSLPPGVDNTATRNAIKTCLDAPHLQDTNTRQVPAQTDTRLLQ
jgi:hypothetical protein